MALGGVSRGVDARGVAAPAKFCISSPDRLHVRVLSLVLLALVIHPVDGFALRRLRSRQIILHAEDVPGIRLRFGQSLCVSADGTRFVVGANAQAEPQVSDLPGIAYLFNRKPGYSGFSDSAWNVTHLVAQAVGTPSRESKHRFTNFGFSCAIDAKGSAVALSAPGSALTHQMGSVRIFHDVDGTWTQTDALIPTDQRDADMFGWELATSDTGNLLVVGSKGRRAHDGEASVYRCERALVHCHLETHLSPPDHTDDVGPRGIRIKNNFGSSLAVSGSGATIVVGSTGYRREQGAVYVFERGDGTQWQCTQRLQAPVPRDSSFFGFKLAIDAKGSKLAVGADGEDEWRGAVYIFNRNATGMRTFQQRIALPNREKEDNFGGSLSFSGDGNVLLVGAPGANVEGKHEDAGAVFVFEAFGDEWDLSARIYRQNAQASDFFAWEVQTDLVGGLVFASAPHCRNQQGCVAIDRFTRSGKRTPTTKSVARDDIVSYWRDSSHDSEEL